MRGSIVAERYKAFISYSHADEAVASWLQRALEGYRIPARLQADHSALPRRLHPVFRDTEELASSADLGDAIRTALARSDTLLVVCSPSAAASRWVNEEIRAFRELAPGHRILCLIAAGGTDPASAECAFPPAILIDAQGQPLPEPLAADIRPTGDGKRGALLKLVAGLLSVGVDDLRQRDQQRKIRFLSAMAAGATIVAAVTIGLAINAHYARQESELRRTQAEGLIGFMLGDLRQKLQPIGKLDILDAVGDQAMTYFEALGDELSDEDSLARVMALRQIGEVRFQQGQLEPALASFLASRDYALTLHERNPAQDDHLFELGQAEFWLGYVAWERNDLDGADTAFRAYRTISQELASRDPGNADYVLELLYAVSNLGSVARERGVNRAALRYFQESVDLNRQLLEQTPDDRALQFDLANGLSWLGSAHLDLGDLQQSGEAFDSSLDILASLHEDGSNARYSEEFVDVAVLLAEVAGHRGNLTAARVHLDAGMKVARALVERDPTNARWKEGLYRCEEAAGYVAVADDRPDEALRRLKAAMVGLGMLVDQDPSSGTLAQRLARVEAAVALLMARSGDVADALLLSAQAGQRSASALAASSGTRKQIRQAMEVELIRGEVFSASGDDAAARNAWEDGMALLDEDGGEDPVSLAIRAALHRQLGQERQAQALTERLTAMGFRNPRYL